MAKNVKNTPTAADAATGSTQPDPQTGIAPENPTSPPATGNDGAGQPDAGGEKGKDQGTAGVDTAQQGAGTGTEGSETTATVTAPPATPETTAPTEPKATKDKRARIAKDIFAHRATLEVIYFTADMVPFATDVDASKHAASLQDKTVTPVIKE